MNSKDKFGFYQVGNDTFYSRVEATEYSKRVGKPIHWNFNESVFNNFNWLVEPPLTLEQLYANRAQQIRESYDYIVVWYSGGADSHNVLTSFLKNNIHVDEIAQFINYEGSKDWSSYLNEEVAKVAAPNTKKIQEQYPHIKHRLVDLTPIIKDLYKVDDNNIDFIYKANRVFSPNQLSRTYIREKIKDYADIIDSGKSLCFIWGSEKPSVRNVNDTYCVYFADLIDNAVGTRTQQLNRSWEHDELFYWTPDAPEIVSKQAHIIKKFCRYVTKENVEQHFKNGDLTEVLQNSNPGRQRGSLAIGDQHYTVTNEGIHKLIYPWWDPTTFSNGKNPSGIFSHRDLWWFLDSTLEDQQRFKYGIIKLKNILGNENMLLSNTSDSLYRINDDCPTDINLMPMLSPYYRLE